MSTMAQSLVRSRIQASCLLHDYGELTKSSVTTLIVLTAWCGYFFGARKAGVPALSFTLFNTLLGVALVSSGTATLNEVLERDVDGRMQRTALRPLPAGRMSVFHATFLGLVLTIGGSVYLTFYCNLFTGALTFLTALVYLAIYTPLKRVSPICTFVGAFPGAMPGVLGWTAARAQLDWGAALLFGIVFLWQFPHFFSIAWLYRDDYARGGIRMLPVVEPDGRSTARRVLAYSLLLIPVSLLPALLGMSGQTFLLGAIILGGAMLYVAARLARLKMPLSSAPSKQRARQLLQATVFYLPLLFGLMIITAK
jgi:heme o synthase